MKAKEKVKVLENLSNECNTENEAMFAVYTTKKIADSFIAGDMDLIRTVIREILEIGIAGKEGEPETETAWAILGALRDIQDTGVNIEDLLTAFDEEREPDDCLDCELFSKCKNERAEAWRTILKSK
jgi:hypothetical protein